MSTAVKKQALVDIHVTLPAETKKAVDRVLAEEGLALDDALMMFLNYMARENEFPHQLKVPNEETQAAIREIDNGEGVAFDNPDDVMEFLLCRLGSHASLFKK